MAVIIIGFKFYGLLSWSHAVTRLLVLLVALTAMFDSLLIFADIVAYNPDKILGVRIGLAPVEDFMYAVLVVVIVPAVWKKLGSTHD